MRKDITEIERQVLAAKIRTLIVEKREGAIVDLVRLVLLTDEELGNVITGHRVDLHAQAIEQLAALQKRMEAVAAEIAALDIPS